MSIVCTCKDLACDSGVTAGTDKLSGLSDDPLVGLLRGSLHESGLGFNPEVRGQN